jgi:hypothetical protein
MSKSSITIEIDETLKKKLVKRADKEMLTLDELIIDILRRSALSYKGESSKDNVDDKLLTFFSRKK